MLYPLPIKILKNFKKGLTTRKSYDIINTES